MKKQSILLFGILASVLSSCVYSLFPIYTTDTLTFRKELLGQWNLNDEGTEYLLFETSGGKKKPDTKASTDYKYSIEIKEGFTMSSNDPISMVINGDTTYDEHIIREELLRRMEKQDDKSEENSESLVEKVKKNASKSLKDTEYSGKVSVREEKSYKLTVVSEDGTEDIYAAHLVDIGGDLFLDLYPEVKFKSKFSENYFPVHTFMKVKIRGNELDMTFFDLEKLNRLFESNLIRLRHENVDGTILITAQPKELQKFLDRYSDDETVFEETETYRKVS